MVYPDTLEHLAQALQQSHRYREEQHREEAPATSSVAHAVTIALEHEPGTPVAEVAREIGARLSWPVYDHELLERIAQEVGVPVHLVEDVDERRQSWLLECIEAFTRVPSVSETTFVSLLTKALRFLATRGHCVIIGRGAAQLLSPRSTLRVSLVGEAVDRVAALGQRLGIGKPEAARKARDIERERVRFLKHHFGKDPAYPGNYDLVLNTSSLSVGECADLLLQALHRFRGGAADQGLESFAMPTRG